MLGVHDYSIKHAVADDQFFFVHSLISVFKASCSGFAFIALIE
jgi:hypothetical protein